jgi:acyl carrier protein
MIHVSLFYFILNLCDRQVRAAELAMLDTTPIHSGKRVSRLVDSILKRNGETRCVSPNDELAAIGLSSIDMVNLMLSVEAEFNITIPQCELTIENFHSVRRIEALLERLIEARPGQCN